MYNMKKRHKHIWVSDHFRYITYVLIMLKQTATDRKAALLNISNFVHTYTTKPLHPTPSIKRLKSYVCSDVSNV